MSDLRKAVIKLAHENPEMRADLLPLLKETVGKTATSEAVIEAGMDFLQNDKGKLSKYIMAMSKHVRKMTGQPMGMRDARVIFGRFL